MRASVSGMNGTIGRALASRLFNESHHVAALSRDTVEQTPADIARLLAESRIDVVFHLAIASRPTGRKNEHELVNVDWPARLAEACAAARVRLVFTSTAMVFSDHARGPFRPDRSPDAREGYGHQKLTAERRVSGANPNAVIVRLGWQIGDAPGGNQMLSYFDQHMREHGVVRASRKWLPACSFLADTAAALIGLAARPGGIYHLDSNSGWTFFDIASALNDRAGKPWQIEPDDQFVYDQRLIDPRLNTPPLATRLLSLAVISPLPMER